MTEFTLSPVPPPAGLDQLVKPGPQHLELDGPVPPLNLAGNIAAAPVNFNSASAVNAIGLDDVDDFALPYFTASDVSFIYYSWQHISGTNWLAQRVQLSDLGRSQTRGENPQPVTLTDFQTLSFQDV